MQKWLIGIDEAGRGPLAGPVSVGVLKIPPDFDWELIPGVNDSKQLSEAKREELFVRAKELQKAGKLNFMVGMVGAKTIDRIGISVAIKQAMDRGLKRIDAVSTECAVKLDGSLKAPAEFVDQETIIKGDGKERVIGLASICAKVTRDRYMRRIASQSAFAPYNFHIHKGYGTKAHREAIAEHGLSPEHRASYCKNIDFIV